MSAAATDKFKKVGRSTATTLSSPGYTIGDVSITVGSTSNWPTSTGVTFAVDTVDGAGVQIAGTYNIFKGVVTSATQISSLSYVGGDANRNYTAGATTRVYIDIDYSRHNEMIDGIVAEHNQDGTHGDITADSLTVSGTSALGAVTATSLTLAGTATAEGWSPLGATPDTVTANGNKSYDLVFNSNDLTDTITPGMRLRTSRTVAAPILCTSLNGTTQYYSKTSPSGMTFTDDFSVSAWVKMSSYGALGVIASRYNGTSGWRLLIDSDGTVYLTGYNAGSANFSYVKTYQSVPLNKWVHISAQLDMSAFTATTTTSYVMIDGVDVPALVSRGGTNPTALVQAGNLEIGSANATSFFPGKIAQVAIYSAKVTQATHLAAMNQGLTGSESNLAAGYSLSNSLNDLSPNANNLSAQGSAVATNADSPFGNSGVSSTLDYAIVMAAAFSTNTTLTVQVPEGCTIPSTGGVTTVDYSTQSVPYGFPRDRGRYRLSAILKTTVVATASSVTGTWYYFNIKLPVPIGAWMLGNQGTYGGVSAGTVSIFNTMSTSTSAMTDGDLTQRVGYSSVAGTYLWASHRIKQSSQAITTMTPYYLLAGADVGSVGISVYGGANTLENGTVTMFADNAYI